MHKSSEPHALAYKKLHGLAAEVSLSPDLITSLVIESDVKKTLLEIDGLVKKAVEVLKTNYKGSLPATKPILRGLHENFTAIHGLLDQLAKKTATPPEDEDTL